MKAFGYKNGDEDNLLSLSKLTIQSTTNDLEDLARFIAHCLNEMKNNGAWEHEHLQDYLRKSESGLDIVIFRG